MAKISQYFKDKAKTIKDYPKTLMKAVYGDDGQRLDNVLNGMNSTMNEFGEYKGISTVLSGTVSLKDTSLVSGHYVCDSVINGPDDTRLTGGYIDVEAHPNSAYRKVKFSPYGLNEWYVITCSGGTWSGWEKVITNSNLEKLVIISQSIELENTVGSFTLIKSGFSKPPKTMYALLDAFEPSKSGTYVKVYLNNHGDLYTTTESMISGTWYINGAYISV